MNRLLRKLSHYLRRREIQREVLEQANRSSDVIWLNCRCELVHLMSLKSRDGSPIFNLLYDDSAGLQPMIFGKPVKWKTPH